MIRRAAIASILGLAILSAACGKKGPPLPPLRLGPSPPGLLRVRQIGSKIVLSSALPGTRTDGSRLGDDVAVVVLRLPATGTLRPGAVSDRYLVQQFQKQAEAIATLTGEPLRQHGATGKLVYVDESAGSAPAAGGTAPAYLYAIQIMEANGRRSPLRIPTLLTIAAPPPVPGGLNAEVAEGEVRLTWNAGDAPDEKPGHGFNIYRKEVDQSVDPETPLNPTPMADMAFVDTTFRYDVNYRYFVRTTPDQHPAAVESLSSSAVDVRPHDHFPPAAPTGIAAAAEGGVVKIYWFPNAEADLAGYRVYRRASSTADFERVGEVGAAETSFIDPGATAGVRYYYCVTAIDDANPINESPRSEERSEILTAGENR